MSENNKTSWHVHVPSLYVSALKRFVQQMDLTMKNLNNMCHLRLLPAPILSDIYCEVINFNSCNCIDPISNFTMKLQALTMTTAT